ncbi:MAG TPA: SxtJ family membrane protein [Polyangia bacterium]
MATTIDTKKLRKFGFTVGGIFTVLAVLFILRHKHHVPYYVSVVAGPTLLAGALVWPRALAPVERGWSLLAHALGWINTRILLAFVFFVVLAPIALFMRIIGKDPLERRPDRGRSTYWRTREAAEADRLTRPY